MHNLDCYNQLPPIKEWLIRNQAAQQTTILILAFILLLKPSPPDNRRILLIIINQEYKSVESNSVFLEFTHSPLSRLASPISNLKAQRHSKSLQYNPR